MWIAIGATMAVLAVLLWQGFRRLESTRLRVGDEAPDFALESQTGQIVRLRDLLQRGPVVLYFYIQDATPG